MQIADVADTYQRVGDLWIPAGLDAGAVRAALSGSRTLSPALFSSTSYGPPTDRTRTERIGHGGEQVQGGRLAAYDDNAGLEPERWRGTDSYLGRVDVMLRSDAAISAARHMLTLLVEQTADTIVPYGEDDGGGDRHDLAAAALMRDALMEHCQRPWRKIKAEASEHALRGTTLHEVVWRVIEDGSDYGVNGPAYTLGDLAPIHCSTINRWLAIDDPAAVRRRWGVEQSWVSSDGEIDRSGLMHRDPQAGMRFLHPDRLLHLLWKPDGDAPEGVGMLRPLHSAWALRQTLRRLTAAGFERAAHGIPVAVAQPGAARGSDDAVLNVLRNLAAGRHSYATIPHGWKIEMLQVPFDSGGITAAMTGLGREIARGMHMLPLYTGEDNGTQALSESQRSIAAATAESVLQSVCEGVDHGRNSVAGQLLAANYGPEVLSRLPSIRPGKVAHRSVEQHASDVAALVASGVLTADADIEAWIRKLMSAPSMSEETREAWEHRMRQPKMPPNIDGDPASAPAPDSPDAGAVLDGDGNDDDEREQASPDGDEAERLDARIRLMSSRPPADRPAEGPGGRQLRAAELLLRASEIETPRQAARDEGAAIVEQWRRRIAPEYVAAVMESADLGAARKVPVPGQGILAGRLTRLYERLYDKGKGSAKAERERFEEDPELAQRIADEGATSQEVADEGLQVRARCGCCPTVGVIDRALLAAGAARRTVALLSVGAPPPRAPGDATVDAVNPNQAIAAVVDTTVAAAADRVRTEALREFQAQSTGGVIAAERKAKAAAAILGVLEQLSVGVDLGQAQGDANTIFGLGRVQEQRSTPDPQVWMVSNLFESQSCGYCLSVDGRLVDGDDDEFDTPLAGCEAPAGMCNCIKIALPATGPDAPA
jgi:hypothetical protein